MGANDGRAEDRQAREFGDLKNAHLDLFHQLIEQKPKYFVQCACEALLGILHENNLNPFLPNGKDSLLGPDHYLVHHYLCLACALLASIDDKRRPDINTEYIPLENWIFTQMEEPHPHASEYRNAEDNSILFTFFSSNEENFGTAILSACYLVYQGIPLYESVDDGQTFRQIPFDHHDYIYLEQKGRRSDATITGRLPDWAKTYFVKRDHLAAHKVFFGGDKPGPEQTFILRHAYRQHIGITSKPKQPTPAAHTHRTKVLDLVDEVIARYYGENFDINDQDSWPKQTTVTGWLRARHNISQREAMAVDLVTRPDHSRGK